jgi:hypothetical protein
VKHSILILGASYGSLFGTKLLLAGHRVALVCTAPTAAAINQRGTFVRFPIKGQDALCDVPSQELPGALTATTPDTVDPASFDLVVLAMQEAQYGVPGVRELMDRVARAARPCLAIMNMPPLPYLRRLAGLDVAALEGCYTDPRVWDRFDPALVTLASPDPQAFRPPDQPKNVLQVGLPTNFKAARFGTEEPTALLRRLAADIEAARFRSIEIPVKLKVHDSLFVPLAKWPMLIAGNYRAIQPGGAISIHEAVHGNAAESRAIYDWCRRRRPGAVREVREGGRGAGQTVVCGAGTGWWGRVHRARRLPDSADRAAAGDAVAGTRCDRRAGGRPTAMQPVLARQVSGAHPVNACSRLGPPGYPRPPPCNKWARAIAGGRGESGWGHKR